MVLENQADVFRIFHDGSFAKVIRNQDDVELIIEIQYLAELINPNFSLFKVQLKNCTKLEYHEWGKEHSIIDDLNILGALYLDINGAEVIDNYISVTCFCFSSDETCGGDLVVVTQNILIFDENDQEVIFDKLYEIGKTYWNNKQ